VSNFGAQYPGIAGTVASLAWYLAGQQSFSGEKPNADAAVTELCVAVMLVMIAGGWAVVKGDWLGLIVAASVLYIEVRSIRRILIAQRHQP
jgi:hypothetical protein